MKNKYIMGLVAAAAVTGLYAMVAEAHTPTVADSCSGVTVNFTSYEHATASITVDGVVVKSKTDFQSWSDSATWDQTKDHTWSVTVDDVGTQYDKSFSGSKKACQPPATTTTTVLVTTTTTPPTSTAVTTTTVTETTIPVTTTTIPETTTTLPATTIPETTTTTVTLPPPPVPTAPPSGLPETL